MTNTLWTNAKIMDVVCSPTHSRDRPVYDRLRRLVKLFEKIVLLPANGWQDQNRGKAERGMHHQVNQAGASLPFERVVIMSYTICGRIMVTLERGDIMFTLVMDETSKESTAGLQGVRGTELDLYRLVTDAIAQWLDHPMLEVDHDVRIFGT